MGYLGSLQSIMGNLGELQTIMGNFGELEFQKISHIQAITMKLPIIPYSRHNEITFFLQFTQITPNLLQFTPNTHNSREITHNPLQFP